jgi:hypothetical protein
LLQKPRHDRFGCHQKRARFGQMKFRAWTVEQVEMWFVKDHDGQKLVHLV